ncbi:hypothetical protein Maq22A_2p42735 (plasmid) [Methylobacterium aquaticum]|uniref:Uncharacterized protein n=1 Tax=Methylobacterium aquaticum TaxID=270351 RepID=A0A1Y0ZGK7_9HYPH|nr:hypothetical protein Maq22A_2p42735 [Methylobacterium aquaticum]
MPVSICTSAKCLLRCVLRKPGLLQVRPSIIPLAGQTATAARQIRDQIPGEPGDIAGGHPGHSVDPRRDPRARRDLGDALGRHPACSAFLPSPLGQAGRTSPSRYRGPGSVRI